MFGEHNHVILDSFNENMVYFIRFEIDIQLHNYILLYVLWDILLLLKIFF